VKHLIIFSRFDLNGAMVFNATFNNISINFKRYRTVSVSSSNQTLDYDKTKENQKMWFSLVFSTNKTDHHNIIEILLKVALNTWEKQYN
jgi:hypothetical protein